MSEEFTINGHRINIYDLSERLSNDTSSFQPNKHRIEYVTADQAVAMTAAFGIGAEYWPDGQGYCIENVELSTHSGTHIDAPAHYGPKRDGGPGRTIDEVPLRWCIGEGVLLDLRHKRERESITSADIIRALDVISYRLKPYDIVLIWTGASRYYANPGYDLRHPGLRRDATEYIVDQGVRLIGIDAWSLDRPFDIMIDEALAGDKAQLWESHLLGREKEYSQIEKLCNLDTLPRPHGFTVIALPVNLDRASAGWARVVALFSEEP